MNLLGTIRWCLTLLICVSVRAAAPATRPTQTVKLPDSTASIELLPIPAGKITITPISADGKPLPPKEFTIKPFLIGKTELTWDVFDEFVICRDLPQDQRAAAVDAKIRPSKPYNAPDRGYGHEGYAAISIHPESAGKFCQWISKRTGKNFRLPTEAEWEYAARAGDIGDGKLPPADLAKIAWTNETADDETHPAGKLASNAWGLHDMFGNAAEWCIAMDGKTMVLRGGSYKTKSALLGFDYRQPFNPEKWQLRDAQLPKSLWWLSDGAFAGFRVVMDELENKK